MEYTGHDKSMYEYYNKRAPHFDKPYDFNHPDYGNELKDLAAAIAGFLKGKRVLEVAAGTGIWTRVASECVTSITATDATPATLAEAHVKFKDHPKVSLVQADAYRLQDVPGTFDCGLAIQWFSHVPKKRYDEFFDSFHGRVGSGAAVFVADSSIEAVMPMGTYSKLGDPDTYQQRKLPDGSTFEIIKNFFTDEDLKQVFGPRVRDLRVCGNTNFWWVTYTVA